jgi:hypothetical protein
VITNSSPTSLLLSHSQENHDRQLWPHSGHLAEGCRLVELGDVLRKDLATQRREEAVGEAVLPRGDGKEVLQLGFIPRVQALDQGFSSSQACQREKPRDVKVFRNRYDIDKTAECARCRKTVDFSEWETIHVLKRKLIRVCAGVQGHSVTVNPWVLWNLSEHGRRIQRA